jgi:hypothetical protein
MKNFYEPFISSIRVSMIHNRLYENLMGFSLEYLGSTKGLLLIFHFGSFSLLLFISFPLFLIFCKKKILHNKKEKKNVEKLFVLNF